MKDEENTNEEHYVCYGGCMGVSEIPGTCQAGDCADYGAPLHECDCTDGEHNDFQP